MSVKQVKFLRKRLNNHRNRLKQLCGLHLYHHFNSNGHTIDDLNIMPIEELTLTPTDKISLSSKRLEREAFWYRERCTIYPYGLNDNVKKFVNVSKIGSNRIVYSLFNKQPRKFRKRQQMRHRKKIEKAAIDKRWWVLS